MAVYWLTFRIADYGNDDDRRQNLYDAIQVRTSTWWTEPTSFILFESDYSIDELAAACKAAIDPEVDIVLIRAAEAKTARILGAWTDADLTKLMSYVRAG